MKLYKTKDLQAEGSGNKDLYCQKFRFAIAGLLFFRGWKGSMKLITYLVLIEQLQIDWLMVLFLGETKL